MPMSETPHLHLVHARAVDRSEVRIAATLHLSGQAVPFTLHNLSADGFMGQAPRHVPLGALVVVELPGLPPVGAKVRWSVGHKAGGRWAQRLDAQQLAVALGGEPDEALRVTAA